MPPDDKAFHRYFMALKDTPDLPYQFQCPAKQGIKAKINHKIDPILTVMLTEVMCGSSDCKLLSF